MLDKIAKILDVTVTELLEGEKRKAESGAVAAGEEGAVEALLKQATEQVQTFKKKDFFASILSLVLCAASLAVVFYTVVSREKSLQNFDFTCILGAVISESVLFMAIGAFASFLALHRPKALWLRAVEFVLLFSHAAENDKNLAQACLQRGFVILRHRALSPNRGFSRDSGGEQR